MTGGVIARFGNGLVVHRTGPAHVAGLAELQRIVFPTLAPEERFEAPHYLRHIELFPEGQLCVVDPGAGDRVVGMTSTVRLDFDFVHPGHTFADVIQGGWLTSHQPAGRWLYGADLGAHPDYRNRGIARALYAARHEIVRELGLDGQVTVGMPSGYGAVKDTITAPAYYAELVAGTRDDPTISAQLRIGFTPQQLLPGYINDPVCDGYGIVLVLPAEREVRFPP
ncbi:MAG: GNAT family N-acetyltransferase [Deltaproteobacteria bacterium]|nr:GNAT family N-acetyltransferase [Deltaproteobacteria bacterium]